MLTATSKVAISASCTSVGTAGTVTAVRVDAGDQVSAGEVLATQNDSLAQANLQEAGQNVGV